MFQKKTEKQQKPKKLRVYTVNSHKPAAVSYTHLTLPTILRV